MDPVELRTDRLVLSVPTEHDLDQVIAYCQDPDVIAHTPVPVPYGRAEAQRFLEHQVGPGWASGERCEFVIRPLDEPARVLGSVSLFGIREGSGEVGYLLDPSARGHGVMTEAVRRVVDWAFAPEPDGRGLVRVQWRALGDNTASAHVAERVGFTYEGRLRAAVLHRGRRQDELVASLLRDDDRAPAPWPRP